MASGSRDHRPFARRGGARRKAVPGDARPHDRAFVRRTLSRLQMFDRDRRVAGRTGPAAQTVDPDVIVLGGGVAAAGPGLLEAVRRALRHRAARSPVLAAIDLANRVALVPDVHAGALGAAVFARRHLGSEGSERSPAGPPTDVSSGTP
jgi:hypothetical protein